ncbi:MAG: hypothetical protein H8E28_10150 [Anaerolineae bacterium]|nr:hypothetical protein [Anaerolineae bacterium]
MDKTSHPQFPNTIPEAAFHSPISVLALPNYVLELLTKNQIPTVGELMQWLEKDRKQILAIRGIGPKILEQLETAIQNFAPTPYAISAPKYPPPVPTLADYYKSLGGKISVNKKKEPEPVAQPSEPDYPPPVPSLADYYVPVRYAPKAESSLEKTGAAPSENGTKQEKGAKSGSKKKDKKKKSRKGKKK